MTKLLEKAIAELSLLPPDQQNYAAEMLLEFANQTQFMLSADQVEGVKMAVGQAQRGEFADELKVQDLLGETWK